MNNFIEIGRRRFAPALQMKDNLPNLRVDVVDLFKHVVKVKPTWEVRPKDHRSNLLSFALPIGLKKFILKKSRFKHVNLTLEI